MNAILILFLLGVIYMGGLQTHTTTDHSGQSSYGRSAICGGNSSSMTVMIWLGSNQA